MKNEHSASRRFLMFSPALTRYDADSGVELMRLANFKNFQHQQREGTYTGLGFIEKSSPFPG
jgi:hypothetical protein